MKELSAGILFFTKEKELFMGRVTGSGSPGFPHRWDIPKGHVEKDESPLRAAVRECTEETSFVDYNPASLIDLGRFKYSSNKDIHIFIYPFPVEHESFRNCECTAFHTNEDGTSFPEMDRFALIKPVMWKYLMGPSLFKVVNELVILQGYPEKVFN